MSTRVLRDKIKAQQEELIGLYQQNAKLKVLIAHEYNVTKKEKPIMSKIDEAREIDRYQAMSGRTL